MIDLLFIIELSIENLISQEKLNVKKGFMGALQKHKNT